MGKRNPLIDTLTCRIQNLKKVCFACSVFSNKDIDAWIKLYLMLLKNSVVFQLNSFNNHRSLLPYFIFANTSWNYSTVTDLARFRG